MGTIVANVRQCVSSHSSLLKVGRLCARYARDPRVLEIITNLYVSFLNGLYKIIRAKKGATTSPDS